MDPVICGDAIATLAGLPPDYIQTVVTSPPYWGLRDYGVAGQLGLEPTVGAYVAKMVDVFRAVRRVLRPDGTVWLNLGDSYAGSWGNYGGPKDADRERRTDSNRWERPAYSDTTRRPPTSRLGDGLKEKDLCGVPWRVALALQDDGWWLRSDIIWAKPNPIPESVEDRPSRAHEYIFLLAKSQNYYYDHEAIKEPAVSVTTKYGVGRRDGPNFGDVPHLYEPGGFRNKRTIWTVPTVPGDDEHYAGFPPELIQPCILAGSRPGDLVGDPFAGRGTTGVVAKSYGRNVLLIDINPVYCELSRRNLAAQNPALIA